VRQGKGCYWRGGSHRTPKPHLSLPPRDGGSSPQGVKGALLILLEASGSKSKACPLPGLPTHLPPLRRGRDGNCRGKLDLSCRCPRRAGEAAPAGAEGGALDLDLRAPVEWLPGRHPASAAPHRSRTAARGSLAA